MTAQAIEGPATGRSGRETAAGLQRADATKARPVRLRRKMSVGDAFGIIAASCLDHLLDNQPAALRRDPEAVHQMRVAIRRLRAAATLMKRMLRDSESKDVRGELRWLGRELGRARDGDIRVAAALSEAAAAERTDPRAQELLAEAAEARTSAYDGLADALGSERYRDAIGALQHWVEAGAWQRAGGKAGALRRKRIAKLAPKTLSRRRKRIVARARGFADLSARQQHQLRISVKTLRYGAEFFESLFRGQAGKARRRKTLDALESLQDSLGDLNDLALAPAAPAMQDDRDARIANRLARAEAGMRTLETLRAFWER